MADPEHSARGHSSINEKELVYPGRTQRAGMASRTPFEDGGPRPFASSNSAGSSTRWSIAAGQPTRAALRTPLE
eukprot:6074536-Pyramimonas_sp.AAC.1